MCNTQKSFVIKRPLIPRLEIRDVGLWVRKRPNACSQVTVTSLQDWTPQ